jgi:hypothetical protein
VTDWSPDGRFVVYEEDDPKTGTDIWVLPMAGSRTPVPYLRTPFNEGQGRLSPDGHWMAYVSNETGQYEVFVQPFPATGAKWQVSTVGGLQPVWRRDGKELFYLGGAGDVLMVVRVRGTTPGVFEATVPTTLFHTPVGFPGLTWGPGNLSTAGPPYVASADGRRFLLASPVPEVAPDPLTLVVNWPAALKQ